MASIFEFVDFEDYNDKTSTHTKKSGDDSKKLYDNSKKSYDNYSGLGLGKTKIFNKSQVIFEDDTNCGNPDNYEYDNNVETYTLTKKEINKLKEKKFVEFERLYRKCQQKIISDVKKGQYKTLYEIPNVDTDYLSYNKAEYAKYLIERLRKEKFGVIYYYPDHILIIYGECEDEKNKRDAYEYLAKEAVKTNLLYKMTNGSLEYKDMKSIDTK